MPQLRKGRDRCGAKRRDGQPCGAPAIPEGLVCRRHGGSAPQVAIVARHRQLELRSYVAGLERLEALGTSREFDALCRALRAREALEDYERKLAVLACLRADVRDLRRLASPGEHPGPAGTAGEHHS